MSDQFIKTGDPKYVVRKYDGRICNAVTLENIPEDEPIFILRGKDKHARGTILHYASMCKEPLHLVALGMRYSDFYEYRETHEVFEPDTTIKWENSDDDNESPSVLNDQDA